MARSPEFSNEFSVCVQEDKWQKLVKTDLKGVAERDVDAIRTLQPFVTRPLRPEDSPLARLHRLWNRDKHQVVTPVVASLASPLPDIRVGVSPIGPDSGLELIPRRDVGEILEARQYGVFCSTCIRSSRPGSLLLVPVQISICGDAPWPVSRSRRT